MNKKELIEKLKRLRDGYPADESHEGVRQGLLIAIGMIDQLLEPTETEKVVVPKFVAEWIEDLKSKEINLLENIYDFTHEEDINNYIREQGNALMRAWLDGYEVEKEKLYYVKLPNTNSESEYLYLAQGNSSGDYWFNSRLERLDYEANACKHKFTEKEIKDYDERYWSFAVEVTE